MKKIALSIGTLLIFCCVVISFLVFVHFKVLSHEKPNDRLFLSIAFNFNSPDICEKIDPLSNTGTSFGSYSTTFLKADCYYYLALKNRNSQLCKKASIPFFVKGILIFGSALTPFSNTKLEIYPDQKENVCVNAIKELKGYTNGDGYESDLPDDMPAFFKRLGYSYENLGAFNLKYYSEGLKESEAEVYFEFYEYLIFQAGQAEKKNFLDRIRHMN